MKHVTNEYGDCVAWCPACGHSCIHGENSYECVKCKAENLAEFEKRSKEATDLWNYYLERLAKEAHEIWAEWTQYMLKRLFEKEPIPSSAADVVQRWYRQMETRYEQLSEREKNSDRQIANRYFGILMPYIQQEIQRQTAACYEDVVKAKLAYEESRPVVLQIGKEAPGKADEDFTWRLEVDLGDIPGDWSALTVLEHAESQLNEGEYRKRCRVVSARPLSKNKPEKK